MRRVYPLELSADVSRRVLERWRRVQVVVLERVEVEDAIDDSENVLAEGLIERERLQARERVRWEDERLACDFHAGIGGRAGGRCRERDPRETKERRESGEATGEQDHDVGGNASSLKAGG